MNYNEMTDEELKNEEMRLRSNVSILNNNQMARKILLNSGYGALGSKYFRYFNIRLASAITLSGQLSIKFAEKYLMEHEKQKNYKWEVIYCDTDSVGENSIIYVNNEKIKIKDYYDKVKGEMIVDDIFNENYVKEIKNGDNSLSVSKKFEIEEKNISYIMKHKVEKEMFEVEFGGKSVIITEDHSIMVKRDNKLISVKPKNILDNDELISLSVSL